MTNWVEKIGSDEQEDSELSHMERMLISAEIDVLDLLKKIRSTGKTPTLRMEFAAKDLFTNLQNAIEELK